MSVSLPVIQPLTCKKHWGRSLQAVRLGVTALFALLFALMTCASFAQAWPTRPVKFISPFPPGGSVDPLARLFAARLTDNMGQQFIVENKTGASGSIGTAFVAKSAPDGYTFVFVFDTHAVNPALIPNLPYDTLKDLVPVMLVGTSPMAIATAQSKPYQRFADVIAAAKAKPEAVSYGSVGNGSLGHLTMTLVQQAGGFKVTHAPYKGGGPMTADALGGQIDLAVGSVAVIAPHVRGGKLRGVAVTGDKRSAAMPDVLTLSEQGFPGFSALAWWGVFAPAGTPRPIIDRLNAEMAKVLADPATRKQLSEGQGMDIASSTPEALQKWTEGELIRWTKVVRDNQIRPD